MAKRTNKRVLVIGDTHCGHRTGLTPPAWQYKDADGWQEKYGKIQRACWDWYARTVTGLGKIDILIHMGDCIDGRGERSGSTELLTTDRLEQCDMACVAIRKAKPGKVCMVRGTPYHAGPEEDFENVIAGELNATIGDHEWYDINGLVFDCKHHIGGSSVPHGRHTAIARDKLWNGIWAAEHKEQPHADVLLRAHVHYLSIAGGSAERKGAWLGMTLPALQGMGSKYGARRCSGHVDFGLVYFDVPTDGRMTWPEVRVAKLKEQQASVLSL